MGDSMFSGIDQQSLSVKGIIVQVRYFPGATTNDMYDYIKPLLKKVPDKKSLLHIGTNNAPNNTSKTILDNMLSLKTFVEKALRHSKVCLAKVKRNDIGKATLTVNKVNEHLSALKLDIVDSSIINATSLNRNGLHLNETGTSKLANNFI